MRVRATRFILFIVLVASLAGAAMAQNRASLGKLGQALDRTPIYAEPNTKSRVFYRVQPYEYLVVKSSRNSKWLQVLLENGRYGFVPESAVAQLPYEVTADAAAGRSNGQQALQSRSAAALAQYSLNYVGTPYVWGGNDMNRGVDCSAFVKNLYGRIGVDLPRTAAEQVKVGKPVQRLEDLQSGDRLYFWENKRNTIGHTGIYLGNGYFVHSSRGRGGVQTDLLTDKWLKILVAARR
jgi:cell wall-associated NlpC family hydrolase